ncbi:MAG: alpha/beta hydrolase [Rhodospirillaceae bacterium]|nr:alpha/beta hydrolase [Rhodospirillaceae bacterium]
MQRSSLSENGVESHGDSSGWEIPEPLAVYETHGPDHAPIVLRRHGNPEGPRLVLSHANGLAADSYYPFWSLLSHRFDLVLYDFRNHGWNPVGDLQEHNISTFVRDNAYVVRAIDQYFGAKPRVGVFHSLSAVTAVLQAAEEGGYSALVLFDPPTCAHGRESQDIRKMASRMAEKARYRQDRFETCEELTEILLRARAFERLLPGVADLITRTTVRPVGGGDAGYQLRCPCEYEAQIFDQLYDSALAADTKNLSCPTKIIGADPTVPFSFLPSVDLGDMVAIDYDFIPGTTHFLQLERPAECVASMLEFLERCGLAGISGVHRATARCDAAC